MQRADGVGLVILMPSPIIISNYVVLEASVGGYLSVGSGPWIFVLNFLRAAVSGQPVEDECFDFRGYSRSIRAKTV